MSGKGQNNVGKFYRQQVLSGFEHLVQRENEDDDSAPNEQGGTPASWKLLAEQSCYQILIPIVIEKVGADSDKYQYRILLNDDVNLLVSPYSKRGKKTTQPAITIPGASGQKSSSIPMVYGIHEVGTSAFSHPTQLNVPETLARLYSFLLGKIDATIQCAIQQSENAPGNDDTGKRVESPSASKKLGADKTKRRGKKVLPQIRNEAIPKDPAKLDETYREILGNGQGNGQSELVGMDHDTFEGTGLEGNVVDF